MYMYMYNIYIYTKLLTCIICIMHPAFTLFCILLGAEKNRNTFRTGGLWLSNLYSRNGHPLVNGSFSTKWLEYLFSWRNASWVINPSANVQRMILNSCESGLMIHAVVFVIVCFCVATNGNDEMTNPRSQDSVEETGSPGRCWRLVSPWLVWILCESSWDSEGTQREIRFSISSRCPARKRADQQEGTTWVDYTL